MRFQTDVSAPAYASMFGGLIHHRDLVWQMTKRDLIGRYRGSLLGIAWSLLHPLLMLGVYTLVFSGIFKSRWQVGATEGTTDFAVVLFAGLLIHGLFAECVNRAPALILANPNFVKKVVFPLELLPWVSMGSALFHTGASLLVLFVGLAAGSLGMTPTILLFPIVVLPFVMFTMGVSWFLAATGVYLRDLGHVVGIATTVVMFLSPVFYASSALPEPYRWLLQLNPLTFIIEQSRDVLVWGRLPNWTGLLVYAAASLLVAQLGFRWFQKARRGFADVL
ncbi:MAG: ABC transporter permease [Vicinamibacterales bacterium]